MKLREDQLRLQGLLKETITLLCKNGLQFKNKFCVEALIGITTDDADVFLVNIKENVRNDGAGEDSDNQFDVSVHKDGSQSESDDQKPKMNRKRPPDQGTTSDVSPVKRTRSNGDEQDLSDDEVSNMSSTEMAANVKREPTDDNELVFVKQELSADYDSSAQQHSQSFDMSHFGQGANFSANDPGLDSSRDGSTSGMGWSQQSMDASNMSMSAQTSQGGSQQMLSCPCCTQIYKSRPDYAFHVRAMHGIGGKRPVCKYCGLDTINTRSSMDKHQRKCRKNTLALENVKQDFGSDIGKQIKDLPLDALLDANQKGHPDTVKERTKIVQPSNVVGSIVLGLQTKGKSKKCDMRPPIGISITENVSLLKDRNFVPKRSDNASIDFSKDANLQKQDVNCEERSTLAVPFSIKQECDTNIEQQSNESFLPLDVLLDANQKGLPDTVEEPTKTMQPSNTICSIVAGLQTKSKTKKRVMRPPFGAPVTENISNIEDCNSVSKSSNNALIGDTKDDNIQNQDVKSKESSVLTAPFFIKQECDIDNGSTT